MRRLVLLLVISGLGACSASAPQISQPTDLSPGLAARAERAVRARLPDPPAVQFEAATAYALAEGDVIVCGAVTYDAGLAGVIGPAPYYTRFSGDQLVRVYVDDGAGFGPAMIGCTRASEGLIAVSD